MNRRTRLAVIGASVAVMTGITTIGTSTAALAADPGTLTVVLPCGCILFDNEYGFPGGITGGLPVGVAASTPAADNHGAATFH